MPKKPAPPAKVVPSPLEEHLGEIWDPRGHEGGIADANSLLAMFVGYMAEGRVPPVTLDQVRTSAETLGHYAGYPEEAYAMECILDSSYASSSYRKVAEALPAFLEEMNALIRARISQLNRSTIYPATVASRPVSDDDLPF